RSRCSIPATQPAHWHGRTPPVGTPSVLLSQQTRCSAYPTLIRRRPVAGQPKPELVSLQPLTYEHANTIPAFKDWEGHQTSCLSWLDVFVSKWRCIPHNFVPLLPKTHIRQQDADPRDTRTRRPSSRRGPNRISTAPQVPEVEGRR